MAKPFRLNTQQLFLTWPQCSVSKESVEAKAKTFFGKELVQYIIAEEEHKDGNKHLHAYFKLSVKKNFKDAKVFDALTGQHGNYQGCRSPNAVLEYVTKEGNYVANFDVKKKLLAIKGKHKFWGEEVLSGKPIHEIIAASPELMMHAASLKKGYEVYKQSSQLNRKDKPKVLWYWGPAGTGKTYAATHHALANDDYYMKPKGPWWDGYDNQKVVVIDEIDKEPVMPHGDWLALCDRYAHSVPVKGGFRIFNSPVVICTSTVQPENCWVGSTTNLQGLIPQVLRRIDEIVEFKNVHDDVKQPVIREACSSDVVERMEIAVQALPEFVPDPTDDEEEVPGTPQEEPTPPLSPRSPAPRPLKRARAFIDSEAVCNARNDDADDFNDPYDTYDLDDPFIDNENYDEDHAMNARLDNLRKTFE